MKRKFEVQRGDVYWIDPNPIAGREMKNRHRYIVITPKPINALGVVMTVPVTTHGAFAQMKGLAVPIIGYDTVGFAVCNQVRTFDLEARIKAKTASYVESLDDVIVQEIVARVVSIIDPL